MGVKQGLLSRKEHVWRVFEYRVPRRTFGPRRNDNKGEEHNERLVFFAEAFMYGG
jgi:hypothetical protein